MKTLVTALLILACSYGMGKPNTDHYTYSYGNVYCLDWNRDIANGILSKSNGTVLSSWVYGYISAISHTLKATTTAEIFNMANDFCKENPTARLSAAASSVRIKLILINQ